ncbi:MFS general substrate transporter [Coniochaeta ligniaria NRRL 30616]|uniref:MFS general substrate transporter n=1 Tax=Coniochaeta ligniaria NRRL 30616 TaxID=1408157 RepID=A0A1J7IF07_9PEZI|nr:MFS general substrate transporter [Coniochaeta ligniaria NRRL 30616]
MKTDDIGSPDAAGVEIERLPFVCPESWPSWRKWVYIALVSYCDCLTFLVSMMLAPSVPQVLATFRPGGGGKPLGSFSVTVYILGFCIGPLLLAPLTDIYGRTRLYRVYIVGYIILTVACGLSPSLETLIVFRFFAGCFGGAPMAIGGAVIADMYPPGERMRPMACYSAGTMLGPTLGPVLGGIITGGLDWRWVFWIASILAGIAALGLFFVLPESHLPTLIRRHTRTSVTARQGGFESQTQESVHAEAFVTAVLTRAISLPGRIAFFHVPCALILVLICVFNGLTNMILSSLGSVYQTAYGFPTTTAGLSYLGIGLGGLTALAFARQMTRSVAVKFGGKTGAERPENALPFLFIVGPLGSAGLLWYGWSLEERLHWIMPIIGLFFFGFTYLSIRLATQIILVEAVPNFSASALAAHTVASSIGGAFLPLGTFPLYELVGYGWGNTVVAATNLAVCLIPLAMFAIARQQGSKWSMEVSLWIAE